MVSGPGSFSIQQAFQSQQSHIPFGVLEPLSFSSLIPGREGSKSLPRMWSRRWRGCSEAEVAEMAGGGAWAWGEVVLPQLDAQPEGVCDPSLLLSRPPGRGSGLPHKSCPPNGKKAGDGPGQGHRLPPCSSLIREHSPAPCSPQLLRKSLAFICIIF